MSDAAAPALVDLGARRVGGEAAIAATAAAPVRHVTRAFLDTLNCRDVLLDDDLLPLRPLRRVTAG